LYILVAKLWLSNAVLEAPASNKINYEKLAKTGLPFLEKLPSHLFIVPITFPIEIIV
jgi:hypothetical protein